jgi:8-oxo-dGTP diphosphatase
MSASITMLQVSAAIIRRSGKYLICQRGPGGDLPLLWEFPGGKREKGESPEECLVRECREELGVGIRITGLFATAEYEYPHRRVVLTFFNAEIASGEPQLRVHHDIRWVSAPELKRYAFCPADADIVGRLANENNKR